MCLHVGRLKLQSQFQCSARAKSDRVRGFFWSSVIKGSVSEQCFFVQLTADSSLSFSAFHNQLAATQKLYRQSIKFNSAPLWFNGHEELFLAIVCLRSQE